MSMTMIEKEYVYDTYQTISHHFDKTRYSIWNCVKHFLDNISSSTNLLEIGCGNGKHLNYRKDILSIGIDFVPNFVTLCKQKGLNAMEGNALDIPFPDEIFDNVISIAVFHHLSTEERRRDALKEMYRVLKKGGKGMIMCWGIQKGDQYVPWKDANKDRYYHFYDKEKFRTYTECINVTEGMIGWEEGNWIYEFVK